MTDPHADDTDHTDHTDDSDAHVGGWLLRAHDADEVRAVIKTYGQVFEFPVDPGPLTDLLAAGRPCFLLVDDPALKPTQAGLWAVGEVVGTPFDADDGSGPMAEVELWPLRDRIPVAELRRHDVLRDSVLFAPSDASNPLVMRRSEVRALEEWDFELVEPTPEQAANLADALDDLPQP